jgi:hypothetical protein
MEKVDRWIERQRLHVRAGCTKNNETRFLASACDFIVWMEDSAARPANAEHWSVNQN